MEKSKIPFEKWVFIATLTTALTLAVVGFILPPTGIIDGSVLVESGILLGFAALAEAVALVKSGRNAKFTHGDTSIEIEGKAE